MRDIEKSSRPQKLSFWKEKIDTLANHIKQKARSNCALNILEAGCGTKWGLDLGGVQYTLTGVDINENALDIRKNYERDLDIAILGDLRTVILEEGHYDVIYSSYVLEHVDGAEVVLKNFVRCLKPGGIIILIIPNRDSVKGFLARMTPFWFHIFYKKYIEGRKMAGKPGHGPFPIFFDKVVSRRGIHEFCDKHGLVIRAEYSLDYGLKLITRLLIWIVHLTSFRSLSVKYVDLIYIIEKP